MKHLLSPLLLLAPLLLVGAAPAPKAGDWPAWRGPAANGSTVAGSYPKKWSVEEVAWKTPLPGRGVSTPIVWRGKVFLTTPVAGQDGVLALGPDGKQLWLTKLGAESEPRHRTLASSCNASPVTDGQGIFVRFRSGRLAALEMDGSVRWQLNLEEQFGPENLYWDTGSSPALSGDLLIVSRIHHGESFVVAFDKVTGKQRWLQKRNYAAPAENDNGYTTPVFFTWKGQPSFLIWGADRLTAHAVADGSLLWECAGFNPGQTVNWPAIANVVVTDGMAVVPVGRDDRPNQAHMHAIRIDGQGDVTASHRVWQRNDVGVFCSTPVEYRGKIYLLRHRGGVVCLDPATGKTLWTGAFPRAASSYYSSPVIANGILYAAREDGTVFAAKVDDQFELLSENAMGERIVASPVPGKDCLLLRGEKTLFCITAR